VFPEAKRGGSDNLLITVMGKGRKEKKIPISLEGRKVLYRWLAKTKGPTPYIAISYSLPGGVF
jgi:site-specific recombinase XerC